MSEDAEEVKEACRQDMMQEIFRHADGELRSKEQERKDAVDDSSDDEGLPPPREGSSCPCSSFVLTRRGTLQGARGDREQVFHG